MSRGEETVEALFARTKAIVSDAVPDIPSLQAVPASQRVDGVQVLKTDDGTFWRFKATSSAVDSTNSVVVKPSSGTGAWLLINHTVVLTLPFTFATADAATLFTVPAGCILHPKEAWWEIAASMTGGASSAIGLHASRVATSKGDLLGGATGDVAATLVGATAPFTMVGTIGTKMATRTLGRVNLIAGDTIKFDQITSAFTAGSGNARVLCDIIANLGA